jgi:DNA-binding Lrp family transcriptional regulator
VRDDLGVGLAVEHVAERACSSRAQLVVVLDDAVVHQRASSSATRAVLRARAAAFLVDGDAAGVVAAVFEALAGLRPGSGRCCAALTAPTIPHMALVEISLDIQTQEALDTFEKRAVATAEVQQCWRVSPGPDFVLVVQVADMPAYQELARTLFTQDSQVRNVRAFFSVKRAKFGTQVPLPSPSLPLSAGKR